MRDKFQHWYSEPIIIPRGLLAGLYLLLLLLGATVSWASSPSLNLLTFASYTSLWGYAVAASSAVAFVGSVRAKLETVETVGVAAIFCLMLVYAFSPILLVLHGDADRASYSVVALIVSLLPAARAFYLVRRAGVHRG